MPFAKACTSGYLPLGGVLVTAQEYAEAVAVLREAVKTHARAVERAAPAISSAAVRAASTMRLVATRVTSAISSAPSRAVSM